jgi:hypothetical protein
MPDVDTVHAAAVLPATHPLSEGDTARLQREFYRDALDDAERIAFETAEEMEGLDREIQVLRVKLRKVVKAKNFNLKLMIRAMDMLNRLVSTRYRISKRSQKDLAANIAAVLQSARSELGLGEDSGPGA